MDSTDVIVRPPAVRGEVIRVRGLVQGVGFRPTVWRLARECALSGEVRNDGDGVLIHAWGNAWTLERFVSRLRAESPPLARIDAIERHALGTTCHSSEFRIVSSEGGRVRTGVTPDAVTCTACLAEMRDPANRRYRYPFINCTHCGPRLSIVCEIPYDRINTTMSDFAMCDACRAEYEDPVDRRFHAQPVACEACGPRVWLETSKERLAEADQAIAKSIALLKNGAIVAIKGLGGFQLACDACDAHAVARLRALKRREGKPFALMARDIDMVRRYCIVSAGERDLLLGPAGPILILRRHADLAAGVAPGIGTLGFMLPTTPLHHLLMAELDGPVVLTSGNLSDEPQCIDNDEARARLGHVADAILMHDRDIARRVDDPVVRLVFGDERILRRARGYAPAPIALPRGFEQAPPVLAMGAEQKNTFCLLRVGQGIVSHHVGDLEEALTYADYRRSLDRYARLFQHEPDRIAVDLHPEYLSRKAGFELARTKGIPVVQIQHHHAHIAACMAENGVPLDAPPVLGVALDGLGFGSDGALWGGEFLRAGYRSFERLGTFRAVAMPGGARAVREPWRNTYAHIEAAMGWEAFAARGKRLELYDFLARSPRMMLDAMIAKRINSPPASSVGRLFDAVAAALGVCRDHASYEGQAAIELEALAVGETGAYPFGMASCQSSGLLVLDAAPMWHALINDLLESTPVPAISWRFHAGLAIGIVQMIERLNPTREMTVALTGGVFQNVLLLDQVAARLREAGFAVLLHRQMPANDGGLSLGQAAIAAAQTCVERR